MQLVAALHVGDDSAAQQRAPHVVLTFERDEAQGPFANQALSYPFEDASWTHAGDPKLEREDPIFGRRSLDLRASGPIELAPPCDLGEEFTVAAHLRDVTPKLHVLFSNWSNPGSFFVCFDPSGEYGGEKLFLRFHMKVATANGVKELKLEIPPRPELLALDWKQTHHLAVTFARGTVSAWLDGTSIGEVHTKEAELQRLDLEPSGVSVHFGASPTGPPYPFEGVCDDVLLWSQALTPEEILRLAQDGVERSGLLNRLLPVDPKDLPMRLSPREATPLRVLSAPEVASLVRPDVARAADPAAEWTFEQARERWQPMTRAVQHVGVPGHEFQTAVLWDGSLVFGPFFRPKEEVALLGENLLHLQVLVEDPSRWADDGSEKDATITRRGLVEGRLPIPWLEFHNREIACSETVFAHLLDRGMESGLSPRREDLLVTHVRLHVHNKAATPRTAFVEFCHETTADVELGYKCRLEPKKREPLFLKPNWVHGALECCIGDRVRLITPRPTLGEAGFSMDMGDDTPDARGQHHFTWMVGLEAGRSADLDVRIPYCAVDAATADRIAKLDTETEYNKVCAFWRELLDRAGSIHTPDPYINDYLAAVAGQMSQQVAYRHTPAPGIWMYKTSPNHYEMLWPCNEAKALPTLDFRGLSKLNEGCLGSFVAMQTDDVLGLERTNLGHGSALGGVGYARMPGFLGNFRDWTANPLLISHGLGMWALANHWRVTRDDAWLGDGGAGTPLKAMLDAFDWVATQRRRTMRSGAELRQEGDGEDAAEARRAPRAPDFGLLPAASAHDWLAGSTIFNDAWCIFGMSEIVRLLRERGHPRADACARELADFRDCLRDDYRAAMARARPIPLGTPSFREPQAALPFAPRMIGELDYARPDWTYTGYGPLRAGACGALDPFDPLVDASLAFLEAGLPRGSPSFLPVSGPELADVNWRDVSDPRAPRHYLWRHYVEYETMWPIGGPLFLARDDLPRFFEWLFNNLAVVLHHDWRVGVESLDGVPSCAPGDGERWQTIRRMFVNETGGWDGSEQELFLLQAIPREWLAQDARIGVEKMGTCFGGTIELQVEGARDRDAIAVSLDFEPVVTPTRIRMRLRSRDGRPLRAAMLDGAPLDVNPGDVVELPRELRGRHSIRGRF